MNFDDPVASASQEDRRTEGQKGAVEGVDIF